MRVKFMSLSFVLTYALLQAATVLAAESSAVAPPQPDPVSAKCLGCHDGTNAIQAGYCLMVKGGSGAGGHPISGNYDQAAKLNPGLNPPRNLPAAIALFEGQITCATCHGSEPHNGSPLAIDNTGSALCRACHLK